MSHRRLAAKEETLASYKGGTWKFIDAKTSKTPVGSSSRESKLVTMSDLSETCTESQKPAYKAINEGRAYKIIGVGDKARSLELENRVINVSGQIEFYVNANIDDFRPYVIRNMVIP